MNVSLPTFSASLALLRQALVDADPLAAPAEAESVIVRFASAAAAEQPRLLLRALDDAIAAIEIGALLADQLHGMEPETAKAELHDEEGKTASASAEESTARLAIGADEDAALLAAYRAFTKEQTAYQSLYHYRNALATRLRLDKRSVTSAAQTPTEATLTSEESHTSETDVASRRSIPNDAQ